MSMNFVFFFIVGNLTTGWKTVKDRISVLFLFLFPYECHPGSSALHVFYEKRAFAEMDTTAINFF